MPTAIRGEKFFKLPQTSLRSASPLLIEGAETGKITLSGSGHELLESDAIKKAYLGG